MQIELELLAPAKNKEIGIAAISCGADALYIAGPKFGARAQAGNPFSEIEELVDYAHKFGVKIYLVINTILYEQELEQVKETIKEAYKIGCDAIIVQDLAILDMDIPPIPIYASTQTNIRTKEQAQLLELLGFKRLILARELSLAQISDIYNSVNTDLESFIHGALCVSYSGQCYMSHKITGRSANRGSCAQACRSDYSLIDEDGVILVKDSPLLSLKDLNLSKSIPALVKAGITSFKIEGRLKGESYVKNIVYNYRVILDKFLANNNKYKKASWGAIRTNFISNPSKTFNRGYTDLFINGERGEWQSENGARHIGEFIGSVEKAFLNRKGIAEFEYKSKDTISNGDGLCIITPKGDVLGIRANSCEGKKVTTTEKINIPVKSKIYRNYDIAFERDLQSADFKRMIPVKLSFKQDAQGYSIDVDSSIIPIFNYQLVDASDIANNKDLAIKNITNQLSKQSDYFSFEVSKINVEDAPFYPSSVLNGVRRDIAINLALKLEDYRKSKIEKQEKIDKNKLPLIGKQQYSEYQLNISNKKSEGVYNKMGFRYVAPAYELASVKNAELMRTKYCIKYQLGLCHKQGKGYNKSLFLINGNSKFELKFDCANCEMIVIG